MTLPLPMTPRDRVMVFAPHPDDETLATGELIQSALAVGARVRVVFATDGDNNPWPQRWLERRWHVGAAERARWGQRRRREALAALAVLGVDDASARFLGWPDQGLTQCLMRDDTAIDVLAQEISGFVPTHVAMPVLGDRHPDHSALRVMLDLALLHAGVACSRLGFVVHGLAAPANARAVAADTRHHMLKQQAMCAHASQVALSRRRLLELAARPERFDVIESHDAAPTALAQRSVLRIAPPSRAFLRREELLLIVATAHETMRFRIALPQSTAATPSAANQHGHALTTAWVDDALAVTLPATSSPIVGLYAKRERIGPRLVIFDAEGWRDAAQLLREPTPVVGREAAASLS
ncbi:MAG: PIG-L family deacetylase [Dokdonella sp.]